MADQSTALYVRLPPDLHRALKSLARRENTSQNYEAIVAIRAHVDASRRAK